MKEENAALCRALSSLTGVSVSPIYPDSPEQFYDEACAARFCRECPYQQKNEFNTHLYGLSEAYRWDGHFIYYCPKAMVFVAAALLDGSGMSGRRHDRRAHRHGRYSGYHMLHRISILTQHH